MSKVAKVLGAVDVARTTVIIMTKMVLEGGFGVSEDSSKNSTPRSIDEVNNKEDSTE